MQFETVTDVEIHAKWGGGYGNDLDLWEDKAKTKEFDVQDTWTPRLVIEGVAVLTIGAGLSWSGKGKIKVSLTVKQTQVKRSAHFYLELKEGSGLPEFPASGTFFFDTP